MPKGRNKLKSLGAPGVRDEIANRSRTRRQTQATLPEAGRLIVARRNDLAPELRVEMAAVQSLRPAARQLRRRDAKQAAKLKASLECYGIVRPLLINASREVIDGHGVLEAAKVLGLEHVPCIVVDHLNAQQQRALRLALGV